MKSTDVDNVIAAPQMHYDDGDINFLSRLPATKDAAWLRLL